MGCFEMQMKGGKKKGKEDAKWGRKYREAFDADYALTIGMIVH